MLAIDPPPRHTMGCSMALLGGGEIPCSWQGNPPQTHNGLLQGAGTPPWHCWGGGEPLFLAMEPPMLVGGSMGDPNWLNWWPPSS